MKVILNNEDKAVGLVPAVMDLVAQLAIKEGVAPLSKTHPGRCWERDLGDGWKIALNGNDFPVLCSMKVEVQPFTVYGERNGFPALMVNPGGGTIGGPGDGGFDLEKELIEILKGILGEDANG